MTAVAVTMMAPPPMPCSARAATNIGSEPANPHSTEPSHEEQHGRDEDGLAADQVAELADDRRHHRRRQQIAGHHPGLVARAAEVGHHRGQRRRHDRLVQGGQQHAEQDRGEDQVALGRRDLGVSAAAGDGGRDGPVVVAVMPFLASSRRTFASV